MPKCFYQRENENVINATHVHTHTHTQSTKVSDKIVLIFKKQLQSTRPIVNKDITPHSYIFYFPGSS
jgi:hypothetical protein